MVGKSITLRVQTREGTRRIQVSQAVDTKALYEQIREVFGYSCCAYQLHKDRSKSQLIISSKTKTVGQQGLNHGDILYLTPENGVELIPRSEDEVMQDVSNESINTSKETTDAVPSIPLIAQKKPSTVVVREDAIDEYLNGKEGLIPRQRDPKACRHPENGCCIYCASLPPYDEAYLKEHKIKHLSFHSHLKKLTSGVDKGKFVALEDLSVRIKEGCSTHSPWPKGICSKCQPSAVTLSHQTYRHVDSVMFENPHIVERFLSYWRGSGFQRMGLLYGSYEEHTDVPLGIRARVAAIYEPPQENSKDSLKFFLNDDKLAVVNEIAETLGLKCVGWVFTDLIPDDVAKGTVKHIRGGHSFFMSAQECITAAYFQSLHPNPCKHSSNGHFGSKFATVIITGDDKNQVHMEGYQVSNQCMAMVRDKCLVPTRDTPELGYVKESSEEQYVPDVYYKQKDEYGNEVTRLGRPLPVEYLLVDVPVSTPLEPQFTFAVREGKTPFPVENRPMAGHLQDFNSLAAYLNQFDKNTPFLEIAKDFHFLVFIATMDIVMIRNYIGPLLDAIKNLDVEKASDWAKDEHWATVEQLVAAASGFAHAGGSSSSTGQGPNAQSSISNQSAWTCAQCTFINVGNNANCEVCQLPR